ncbi:hypothetical protein [Bradyrhizobium sp.]|uniref:hypothetical protein n=1 Tax=Bradyrhizobium sp. TaxID=376 RepID=UPI0025C3DEE9|nr:hypothetical protein [Bradyrhizobium sp.]
MEWDKRVQNEADRLGVLDYAAIAGYGIASTSGIVVDGKVVHADGLPEPDNPARLACGLR